MKRLPSLDGFRAISIILVLIFHSSFSVAGFPYQYRSIVEHGKVGVTIFFVISGFLITNLLLSEEAKNGVINLKAFYIRRICRIIPVYALYVAFIVLMRNIEQLNFTDLNLIHALTFTVNFDPNKFVNNWNLSHLWSLSVEEQFYIFWPAILIFFRKHLKITLIILIAYSCLARIIAHRYPEYEIISLSSFFIHSDAIFIGALGGIVFFQNPAISKHWVFNSYLAQLVALSLIIVFICLLDYGMLRVIAIPFGNLIISIAALFLMIAYINPSDKIIFKILNSKVVVHIGILSYSIYIWQQFFFMGDQQVIWRTFPFNILIIYCVSLASYYLWEKPFLRIKQHFSIRKLQPQN